MSGRKGGKMKNSILKSVSLVMIFLIITKVLGLVRETVLAYAYGTTYLGDAYVLGITISQIVLTGATSSFFTAYIPIAVREKARGDKALNHYTSNLINVTMIVFLVICLTLTLFADPILRLIAGNASEKVITAAIIICRLNLIPSAFMVISNIFTGYLQVNQWFLASGMISLLMNLIVIVSIFIGKDNYYILGAGYGLSLIIPALYLGFYSVIRFKYRYTPVFHIRNSNIVDTVTLSFPIFVGGMVGQLNEIIDRSFASSLSTGIVSSMRYAKLTCSFIITIIAISIGQVIYPEFVKTAEENTAKLKQMLEKVLSIVLLIMIPIFFIAIAFSQEIIRILFMRGAFDAQSVKTTSTAFTAYAVSLPAVAFSEILSRVYYSLKDSKTPIKYFSIAMGINIVLNFMAIYVFHFGYLGLAAATSIAEIISMSLMLLKLNKSLGKIAFQLRNIVLSAIASAIIGILAFVVQKQMTHLFRYTEYSLYISFFITMCVFWGLYVAVLYLVGIDEVKKMIDLLRKKIKTGKG